MVSDPAGRVDIGIDGVMRSLSGDGTILDYYKLNATELSITLDFISSQYPEKEDALLATFEGIDGTLITDDGQLFDSGVPLVSTFLAGDSSPIRPRTILERQCSAPLYCLAVCATGCLSTAHCWLVAACDPSSICVGIFCLN